MWKRNLITGIVIASIALMGFCFIHEFTTDSEQTIMLDAITIRTALSNANGIKRYAPVHVHGISAGKIENIWFSEIPGENLVKIDMSLNKKYSKLIAISNPDLESSPDDPQGIYSYIYKTQEGLLGDCLLDIYAGNPTKALEQAKSDLRKKAEEVVRKEPGKEEQWDPNKYSEQILNAETQLKKNWGLMDTGHLIEGGFIRYKTGDYNKIFPLSDSKN